MAGRLLGIARKAYKYAPMETLTRADVTIGGGVEGDYRGILNPAKSNRRQVTVFLREDWEVALGELGVAAEWSSRRCNLYVEGLELPREGRLSIGAAVFEITGECDPCKRMEAVAEGLFPALKPDWRGGRLMRVVGEGAIALGDEVRIDG